MLKVLKSGLKPLFHAPVCIKSALNNGIHQIHLPLHPERRKTQQSTPGSPTLVSDPPIYTQNNSNHSINLILYSFFTHPCVAVLLLQQIPQVMFPFPSSYPEKEST